LTEDGSIEMYEVKFGDIVEMVPANEFIATEQKMHEHAAKEI
jgi:hypothetical protein